MFSIVWIIFLHHNSFVRAKSSQHRDARSAICEADPEASDAINRSYPGLEVLSEACQIFVVDDFLTAEEVRLLPIDALWHDSFPPDRRSQSACPSASTATQAVVGSVHRKIDSVLPGLALTYREPVVITRYKQGGHHNEHMDWRRATMLMYLNNNFTGGSTDFPQLRLRVQPKAGRAVVFFPNRNRILDAKDYMSHASLEVISGEKVIAQVWIGEDVKQAVGSNLDTCHKTGKCSVSS